MTVNDSQIKKMDELSQWLENISEIWKFIYNAKGPVASSGINWQQVCETLIYK